ncbi:histidine triad nucleotide-binding protein [archaeon]|nr:histidine triad nucleotide-binding protein [archaeon]
MGCIFCKIVNNEIPASKVFEDELVVAFDDIQPLAPVHIVIIPKQHITDINALNDREIWFAMLNAAQQAARIKGIEQSGYRLVVNCGEHGTQIIWHVHLHIIGGRQLESKLG